jgi:hypothetical protein
MSKPQDPKDTSWKNEKAPDKKKTKRPISEMHSMPPIGPMTPAIQEQIDAETKSFKRQDIEVGKRKEHRPQPVMPEHDLQSKKKEWKKYEKAPQRQEAEKQPPEPTKPKFGNKGRT